PGRYADLLIVRKDRIFFPPGRYDGEPFLDVVLDRAESGDIDTVMAAGRVLMEGGRVTVVDEARVRDRFAEAVAERVDRPSAEVRGGAVPRRPGRDVPARFLPPLVRAPHRARLRLQPPPAAFVRRTPAAALARAIP